MPSRLQVLNIEQRDCAVYHVGQSYKDFSCGEHITANAGRLENYKYFRVLPSGRFFTPFRAELYISNEIDLLFYIKVPDPNLLHNSLPFNIFIFNN
jgi:hypothetical protein